jgi:hypothetical protein
MTHCYGTQWPEENNSYVLAVGRTGYYGLFQRTLKSHMKNVDVLVVPL